MLAGNVLVSNGVTLTIEAGTTVNLNTHYIMVNGTLMARGNSAEQISFQPGQLIFTEFSTGWNEQTGSGSIIENAFFNSTEITINNAAPKITNNLIDSGAITIEGGSPVISNNNFLPGRVAVNGGSPIILGNNMYGQTSDASGVWLMTTITVNGGSPVISRNNIHDADIGVEIKQGNPYVSDNNISVCHTAGIIANVGTIERNYIFETGYGIKTGNATIQNNTLVSQIYVEGSSSPTIIYNNLDYGIRLASSNNIDAAHNWWGTTNDSLINQKIWDYKDDFTLGTVNFVPFLTAPNPQAMPDANSPLPTPSTTPSPTPTPTSSPTPTQSANPSPSPSQNPTTSPTASQTELYGVAVVVLGVVVAVLAVVVVALMRKVSRFKSASVAA